MVTLVNDPIIEQRLQEERAATGADRYDEVWEGVYMMAPMPNDEHQEIVSRLVSIFEEVIGWPGRGKVRPGVNVSDNEANWKEDYRVPDVAIFLESGAAKNCGAFWLGGPDFAVEVVSPGDETAKKLPFYARIGMRELLIVQRDPWCLQRQRLSGGQLVEADRSDTATESVFSSEVIPFNFRLKSANPRPQIEVVCTENDKVWRV